MTSPSGTCVRLTNTPTRTDSGPISSGRLLAHDDAMWHVEIVVSSGHRRCDGVIVEVATNTVATFEKEVHR